MLVAEQFIVMEDRLQIPNGFVPVGNGYGIRPLEVMTDRWGKKSIKDAIQYTEKRAIAVAADLTKQNLGGLGLKFRACRITEAIQLIEESEALFSTIFKEEFAQ